MSDPLQDAPVTPHIAALKFAKLHSPKMKSVYWRYFGFPTNEDNCIITKQNVVCTLCHKVLTNHGNTTNLRAHLQYRHKEIFQQIVQENGIHVPPRRPQTKITVHNSGTKIKREPMERKHNVKMEYTAAELNDSLSNDASVENSEHNILYESVVPMTYEDDDVIDTNHFTKIEVTCPGTGDIKPSCSELLQLNNRNMERTAKYRIRSNSMANEESTTSIDSYQLQEALVHLVINDIRSVDSLYDTGMAKFIQTLCGGNVKMPEMEKVSIFV